MTEFKENFRKKIIGKQKGERNEGFRNKRDPSPSTETPSKIQELRNKAVSVFKNRDKPNIKPANKRNVTASRKNSRQDKMDAKRDYYEPPQY